MTTPRTVCDVKHLLLHGEKLFFPSYTRWVPHNFHSGVWLLPRRTCDEVCNPHSSYTHTCCESRDEAIINFSHLNEVPVQVEVLHSRQKFRPLGLNVATFFPFSSANFPAIIALSSWVDSHELELSLPLGAIIIRNSLRLRKIDPGEHFSELSCALLWCDRILANCFDLPSAELASIETFLFRPAAATAAAIEVQEVKVERRASGLTQISKLFCLPAT